MVLKRLPIYFPNLPLKLMPLSEVQRQLWDTSGYVTELVFRTTPRTNKVRCFSVQSTRSVAEHGACFTAQIEIKRLLESLYGIKVKAVSTINYEGKKKRDRAGYYKRPDYKKAFVELEPPPSVQLPSASSSA